MTNCVEYNEYKRGERNEAVISTLRPFMAKFADALKYGIVTLILTASAVYGLSQNISTLESQTGYFNADGVTIAEQTAYIDAVNKFRVEWNEATDEQRSDKEYVDDFSERIENYEAVDKTKPLAGHQISPEYVSSIGDAAIMTKNDKGEAVFVSLVKDVEAGKANEVLTDGKQYSLAMSYSAETLTLQGGRVDKAYNAANANFKDNGDLSMRLWLRMGVSLIPIVFLIISLIIQHKKFIITEDYYDMMLEEIDRRKENLQQAASEPTANATVTDLPEAKE